MNLETYLNLSRELAIDRHFLDHGFPPDFSGAFHREVEPPIPKWVPPAPEPEATSESPGYRCSYEARLAKIKMANPRLQPVYLSILNHGTSVEDIAFKLGIRAATIREHFKRNFVKADETRERIKQHLTPEEINLLGW